MTTGSYLIAHRKLLSRFSVRVVVLGREEGNLFPWTSDIITDLARSTGAALVAFLTFRNIQVPSSKNDHPDA